MNKHTNPFHLVRLSPWPLLGSLGLLELFRSFAGWIILNRVEFFIFRVFMCITIFFQWWRDIIREGEYQGFHVSQIVIMLRYRFLIFIISELFFFISFFWSYFHSIFNPPLECGRCWPPQGVTPFEPYGIPIINSFILVSSGMTVTVSHHLILMGEDKWRKCFIFYTVFLGIVFTILQRLEYYYATFSISDSVYGSLFFLITGFHGIHVIVGSLFLIYCYYRMNEKHFLPYHHVGFEAASWYWHFVDVVWLFLYIIVYWWTV